MKDFAKILPKSFVSDPMMTNSALAVEQAVFIRLLDKCAADPELDSATRIVLSAGQVITTAEALAHAVLPEEEASTVKGRARVVRALAYLESAGIISKESRGCQGTLITIENFAATHGESAFGTGSYVSLPAGVSEYAWYTDANVRRLYLDLLLGVSIKRHMCESDYYKGFLDAGDIIWGSLAAAKRYGVSPYMVRKWLKTLESSLAIATNPIRRVGTIVHVYYSVYTGGRCFSWDGRRTELTAADRTEEDDDFALTEAGVTKADDSSLAQAYLRRKSYWEKMSRETWGEAPEKTSDDAEVEVAEVVGDAVHDVLAVAEEILTSNVSAVVEKTIFSKIFPQEARFFKVPSGRVRARGDTTAAAISTAAT